MPQYAAVQQFDIDQKGSFITIRRTNVNANNEESTTSEKLTLDGKPCSHVMNSKKTKNSTIIWSPDEQTMTIVSTYSFPENPNHIEYKNSQTWNLPNVGKELTVILTTSNYTIKAVYDKQYSGIF